MNENFQLNIKEYLCWVSFWFVIFPWEATEFNATFILMCWYTLCGTIFFRCRKRGHFISQLHPAPILIWQIWNFAAYQTRFCSLTWHLKWLGTLSRTRDMTSWSLVLFSSAKFTQKMSIKLFISYTTVFGIQFSFDKIYLWYVSMTFVMAELLV